MLDTHFDRYQRITPDHLTRFQSASKNLAGQSELSMTPQAIDAFVAQSDDVYLWHMEPGAVWSESPLLRSRMEEAGIAQGSRLAHGAIGLIHALRVAAQLHPDRPLLGLRDVRYLAPIFDGARVGATVAPDGTFVVTTDQLEPPEAITGRVLFGEVDATQAPGFDSLAEQQLFTLEQSIGVVSALIGLSVQTAGGRVLYMGQELRLEGLLAPGDELEVRAEIVERRPGKRAGERVTAAIRATHKGERAVAAGESIFLYLELAGLA